MVDLVAEQTVANATTLEWRSYGYQPSLSVGRNRAWDQRRQLVFSDSETNDLSSKGCNENLQAMGDGVPGNVHYKLGAGDRAPKYLYGRLLKTRERTPIDLSVEYRTNGF